jgi:hypothetical protein
MPITNAMRLLLKKYLLRNLNKLAGLNNHKGRKLTFSTNSGKFDHSDNRLARTVRNKLSEAEQSVTNKDMFHDPVLVTMYEGKKLHLKGQLPPGAFQNALQGLEYLLNTYPLDVDPKTSLETNDPRKTLHTVIQRAERLRDATDRTSLDNLIRLWVDIELPFARLPNDMPLAVVTAAIDNDIWNHIYNGLTAPTHYQQTTGGFGLTQEVRDKIYDKIYKPGGGAAAQVPADLDNKGYAAAVKALGAKFHQEKLAVFPDVDNYFHFYYPTKGKCSARVYIHLQADRRGEKALGALEVLCNILVKPDSIDEKLRMRVEFFKICQKVSSFYKGRDSAVVYMASYADAKAMAMALVRPLAMYTADGVPAFVRQMGRGIGVATEPEIKLYEKMNLEDRVVSYGKHRSELIAYGLIEAAINNKNCLPKDPEIYMEYVTEMFQDYGMDPLKPYKRSLSPDALF